MPWNQNIPQPGDKLSQSQADLRGNFQALDTYVQVDHVAIAAADQGKHKKVSYVSQAYVAPILGPVTAANEAIIFARDSIAVPGTTALFYKGPGLADIAGAAEFSYANAASPGYTILPSGIWLQWGTGNGNAQQNFVTAFPTACLNVQVTETGNGSNFRHFMKVDPASITAAQFTAYSIASGGGQEASPYYYFAIGY